jgi:Phage integrase family.
VPHAFTNDELRDFFQACDKRVMFAFKYQDYITRQLNRLELPVYYRLLLSTGMRTNEARWLNRSDVNLIDGVININQTKGFDQHRVALHDSMLRLLKIYEERMDKIMPDRTFFFQTRMIAFTIMIGQNITFVIYGTGSVKNLPGCMT